MYKNNPIIANIYNSSPVWLKNNLAYVYSYLVSRRKYGKIFSNWELLLCESERWSSDQLDEYRMMLLRDYLYFVKEHSSYYNRLFTEYQFDPLKISHFSDIKSLPVLTKNVVRDQISSIMPSTELFKKLYAFKTSGTTGTSLEVKLDDHAYQREYAFRWHYLKIGGASRKDKFAYFLGNNLYPVTRTRPPYHIIDKFEKSIFFSIFHISNHSIKDYVNAFNSFNPKFLKGYPSGLYSFAYLIRKHGMKVHGLQAIYSASEVLHPFQQELLENVFQAPVYQWYGQVETTVNLHECEFRKLHVKEEYGLLELLNENGETAAPGEVANVIGTSWGNKAFPLIRYDTGDNMILAQNQNCSCGRNGRIVEKIIGRDEDFIITPDGRYLGRLDFIFKPVKTVIESQIIQVTPDEIVVNVVPSGIFTKEDEQQILHLLHSYLGSSFRYSIEIVDKIARTQNGKIRYVENRIGNLLN